MDGAPSGFWRPGSDPTRFLPPSATVDNDGGGGGGRDAAPAAVFNFSSAPLRSQRRDLPIFKHRRQILYAVETYPIVIIVGETGSGKSTQIPQYLLEGGWAAPRQTRRGGPSSRPRRIACTQPRRIAAITLARRVAEERGTALGDEVGYAVRFDESFDPETTKIKFATDGILVREALTDPLLRQYSVVVVDEAHERGLNSDVLLGLLKKVRRKRPGLRIVVCSATIDAEAFLDFFLDGEGTSKQDVSSKTKRRRKEADVKSETDGGGAEGGSNVEDGGVIISIDGRQHPVDVLYSREPVGDYVRATVDTALRIHLEEEDLGGGGDILCFLPSAEDIDRAVEMAEESLEYMLVNETDGRRDGSSKASRKRQSRARQVSFLPLYGSLPYHLQARVFQDRGRSGGEASAQRHRRVVFSTNIAETSVTVPNIKYVVDSGFAKLPYFDPTNGFDRLVVCPVSRASAKQRAGRAGRVRPGKCYRLYTEAAFAGDMVEATPPEVLRTNLSSFVLTLKALGVEDFVAFDLMSPPSLEAVSNALETLYALGALDDGCSLTDMGWRMSAFPTDPRVARMLLTSLDLRCGEEALRVAAVLQVRDVFVRPRTERQRMDFDVAMGDVVDPSGDHVTYVNVMERVEDAGGAGVGRTMSEEECRSMFFNFLAVTRAEEIRLQLRKFLSRYGRIESCDGMDATERSRLIRKCVTSGFFFNVARLENDGRYYALRGKHLVKIGSSSVLARYGESSEYIIFGETYDGSDGNLEVRSCSAIEGRWLRELAPHYWA